MLCLKVPKSKGEKVRHKLLERNLINKQAKIESDDEFIYIPIKEEPLDRDLDYPILDRDLEDREQLSRDYTEVVDVSSELIDELPSSYDIVGDIAIIKIPEGLYEYKAEIGRAILEVHPNLKTVLEDKGVTGEYRIRDVEHITGEEKTVTVHKEYGAELEVDLSEAYFSPRLATERWRVVNKVDSNETILDMFAGVGPYTVLIGKNKKVKHIHSIDINPKAIYYLKRNLKRNSISELVTVYEGDAKKIAPKIKADRIIMNLPHSNYNFLSSALRAVKEKAIIHYYEIFDENEKSIRENQILDNMKENKFEPNILEKRQMRTYSATKIQMAYDIEVTR